MSQLSSVENLGGNVPADLKCGFCHTPVRTEYYRALNKFACTTCVSQIKGVIDHNMMTPNMFARAIGAGLLTGLGCAVAWAVIVHITNFEIGIVASLIGYAVGKAVYNASGKRRGTALQWIAATLSVVGIVGGKLMLFGWALVDVFQQKGITVTPGMMAHYMTLIVTKDPSAIFGGFDLVWAGIAVLAAYRICKLPRITIAGPYPHTPPGESDLQFHTVEPELPPSTAEPS